MQEASDKSTNQEKEMKRWVILYTRVDSFYPILITLKTPSALFDNFWPNEIKPSKNLYDHHKLHRINFKKMYYLL